MRLTCAVGASQHVLDDVSASEPVGALKARLAAECGLAPEQQRWLVKGKTADDDQSLAALGLLTADKAKVMVLRAAAAAAANSSGRWLPALPRAAAVLLAPVAQLARSLVPSASAASGWLGWLLCSVPRLLLAFVYSLFVVPERRPLRPGG